eukprot:CAMPEP_0194346786 /NCGR_PEP_ID=MMETSP0171-20130528/105622_1 /TAXON_ID=218684 /ORGANISM="Corethron pennatum, Strain L29A3" /LENGTH=55 /DNA_ID=CAMNT_0039113953 /DNA_START=987 /DNA_END=1154 /DNA_ORIENTATION=+
MADSDLTEGSDMVERLRSLSETEGAGRTQRNEIRGHDGFHGGFGRQEAGLRPPST